jgi:putative serine/threonine protein kinase
LHVSFSKVYRLTHNKCVKYFFEKETCKKELAALKTGQGSPGQFDGQGFFLFDMAGKRGALDIFHHNITISVFIHILNMLDELKKIGFTRWDAEIRHILINEHGNLKVISCLIWRAREVPWTYSITI